MISAFALGSTEFILNGLLPEVSRDLDVSISTAGLLISGYALGVVAGALLLTAATIRMRRKPYCSGCWRCSSSGIPSAPSHPGMACS
ncbi:MULTISPECIES: hypothetical protein [unclassified Nocardia]|uniref:hypothetical protein n=1 Tax=unclassified Nocardia TaxID=2637762 RepID=UPI001CE44D51|nr:MULTISPECIES: hypothetical protein [unclassified Nocardia]